MQKSEGKGENRKGIEKWVHEGVEGKGAIENKLKKLAKLGDAIAISKSETITDSLTNCSALTDRGRC